MLFHIKDGTDLSAEELLCFNCMLPLEFCGVGHPGCIRNRYVLPRVSRWAILYNLIDSLAIDEEVILFSGPTLQARVYQTRAIKYCKRMGWKLRTRSERIGDSGEQRQLWGLLLERRSIC